MEFHYLDLVAYIVGCILLAIFLPEQFKEELGAVAGFAIWMIYTIVWVVVFVAFDYNVIDLWREHISTIEFKL